MAATNESIKTLKNPVKGKEAKVPKAKPVKPLKLIEKKKWGNLTPVACLKSVKTASHLSSKSVNSNASAVGVRLDPADRLPLPFVAVSTLDAAKVPVDYVMGATEAGPLKQITSVLDGTYGEFFTEVSPEQVSMIEGMRGTMLSAASVGTNFIDPRLRQLVWPTGDEASPWVALTPLQSSGLSERIRERLVMESEAHINPSTGRTLIYRPKAVFGIGGSNPQNVGRYVRSMQRPLVFNGPKENKDIRQAYALHFKGHLRGLAFAVPKKETLAFALWRRALQEANGGSMPSNAAIRQQERDHIQAIASASMSAAAAARRILEQHQEKEEWDGLTVATMDSFLRSLIDPELRDRNFKRTFAQKLIRSIERFNYKRGSNEYVVGGDGELAALISCAEEVCP